MGRLLRRNIQHPRSPHCGVAAEAGSAWCPPHPYSEESRLPLRRKRRCLVWGNDVTLTTRLSVFFLVLLGLVLTGFSTTLYLLARTYLHREIEDRLHAAMNTLVAAVEISPDYVEWEPTQRNLTFGTGIPGDPLLWVVSDENGRI